MQRYKDYPNNNFKNVHYNDMDIPNIKKVKEIANKTKISMSLVSLAWIYSQPIFTTPVLGFTK